MDVKLKYRYAETQTDSHADLRLAALTQLYNVVVDAPLQFRVLLRTLAYAKAANLAGLLAPVVKARPHCLAGDLHLQLSETGKGVLVMLCTKTTSAPDR